MDHSYFRDKISAYSDGALEAQERELIRRHLEDCVECRELLERLNKLNEVIEEKSGLAGDEYFENLAQKIDSQIASPREKVVDVQELRWKSFWWKISAAAALVLLVATLAYYQFEDNDNMPSQILKDGSSLGKAKSVNDDSTLAKELFESGQMDRKNERDRKTSGGRVLNKDQIANIKETPTKPDAVGKDERQAAANDELKSSIVTNAPAREFEPTVIVDAEEFTSKRAETAKEKVAASQALRVDSVEGLKAGAYAMQNTLADWRSQRDSIETVLGFEQDTVQNVLKNQLKKLAAPSVSGLVRSADSLGAYQQLANSWYQIGLQTPDTTEKNRAVQFLNWYKARFPVDSPKVNQQLQQLPK